MVSTQDLSINSRPPIKSKVVKGLGFDEEHPNRIMLEKGYPTGTIFHVLRLCENYIITKTIAHNQAIVAKLYEIERTDGLPLNSYDQEVLCEGRTVYRCGRKHSYEPTPTLCKS